jgi:co-chaperonin GroES (HSP10)
MKPLGNKILVRDIIEEKKSAAGLDLSAVVTHYRKVEVVEVSADSNTELKSGDICLCNPGGVELEAGLWLCPETLLDCKL